MLPKLVGTKSFSFSEKKALSASVDYRPDTNIEEEIREASSSRVLQQ